MQERPPISPMDLKVCISTMQKNARFTEEMIQLVRDDLLFGLTKEETEEYTERKLDYKQMLIYSQCLRSGYSKEVREVLAPEWLSAEQMAVAVEFYEKGVDISAIKDMTVNKDNTAYAMKKQFQNILSGKQEKVQSAKHGDSTEYRDDLKGFAEQLQAVLSKIEQQDKRYESFIERFLEMQNSSCQQNLGDDLQKQMSEKDEQLIAQQEEINRSRLMIVRLRNEIGEMNHESQGDYAKQKSRREPEPSIHDQAIDTGDNGKRIHMVPIHWEREKRKRSKRLSALFSRFYFHKRLDIIRLVAENNLSPEQLVQIRHALQSGLNEQQLLILIHHDLPAEQMEEIILIGIYENEQERLERGW